MNKEALYAYVESMLKKKRYTHTLGVIESAKQLAIRYGVDEEQAEIAALLHDVAKCLPVGVLREYLEAYGEHTDMEQYGVELLHAPVGVYIAKTKCNIQDEEILEAILYHTTGYPHMSKLAKVIFLADYIEPNRNFPGVEEARQLAEKNLDAAIQYALKHTIQFLLGKNQIVYPGTLLTYNEITRIIQEENTNE